MLPTLTIPGYSLSEVIHEGTNTVVYRAASQADQHSVILKVLKAEYPSLEQITRLKQEYRVTEKLDLEHVVRAYRLEPYQNRLVLVSEDFGGQSLKQWLLAQQAETGESLLSLTQFLSIAVQLAKALRSLQAEHIIHKDIKPSNVIINPSTGVVKLTDFSIASRLSKETPQLTNPSQLEGTLSYMSPEQTGRMNRSIDYRSDFYSLGITFYELLTGQLPFQSHDSLELVHCHIARHPIPIQQLNPAVPTTLVAIVSKLMAKNAEDRYQTASGLLTDLEFCLDHLKQTGSIPDLVPGAHDRTAQLLIPQKLYGREQEVETLLAAFARISGTRPDGTRVALSQPRSELMLISGYSGIGKSSLVNEVHKPIVQRRGYFIAGKFDQFKRNIPYAPLIQAFQALTQQLLTESAAQLQQWRDQLLTALGNSGQVIVEVIPEVELIIGKQPALPALSATEAQHRFRRTLQAFIQVFAQPEHPLVLFLDDLQWADAASLKLIQVLLTNPDSQSLLLIGAYRDNEVSPVHPLMKLVAEMQLTVPIHQIVLRPLDRSYVHQIITDALNLSSPQNSDLLDSSLQPHPQNSNGAIDSAQPSHSQSPGAQGCPAQPPVTCLEERSLSDLLFHKTQGNPFFLTQLLKTLHQEQFLYFDFEQGCWQWNLQQIQAAAIADVSVVELIAGNIQKLPALTQTLLKLAACVGDRFSIHVLVTVSNITASEVAEALQPALHNGLILPLNQDYKIPLLFAEAELEALGFTQTKANYRFLHDRVQQAAYSLIPEAQKQLTHLRIGQLLLQHTQPEALDASLFEIVNALNAGSDLLETASERTELARLNLLAGRKAKTAAAYEPALSYLNRGIALLSPDSWQQRYDLTLNLYAETAEVAYLTTHYDLSEQLTNILEQQATCDLDKVKAYELRIQFYLAQLKMGQALNAGLTALNMLGISIACSTRDNHLSLPLPELNALDRMPVMTDPTKLAALRILSTVTSTAYQTQPEIFRWIVLTQLELCLEHGHSALAAFAYIAYAWFCGCIQASDRAYQAGQIALKLLEQFDAKEMKASVFQLFESFVRHQKEHVRETFKPLEESIHVGLETGNIEFAGYSTMNYMTHLFLSGESLDQLNRTQADYIELLLKLKQEFQVCYTQLWHQVTLNLIQGGDDPCCLMGNSFDETSTIPRLQSAQNHQSLFAFYSAKLILNYLFQNYAAAVARAQLAQPYLACGAGLMLAPVYQFYSSLALLADADHAIPEQQNQAIDSVLAVLPIMQQWAESAPMNYQHKYDLLVAELARVQGQLHDAMDAYDRAIQGAITHGYLQEAALANERAAAFYETQGKQRIAQGYMTDAYYGYIQWGAIAKAEHLRGRYPGLILVDEAVAVALDTTETLIVSTTRSTRSTSSQSEVLDMTTAMKAAEAIASELQLETLLCRILHIILENTGAQKGCLILERDGELFIEAIDDDPDQMAVTLQSTPVSTSSDIPLSIIHYVARTQQPCVLLDATEEPICKADRYIQQQQPRSILCAPIFYQGQSIGIIYLENNSTMGAFTPARLELLKLLTAQAAIAIENARLYAREQERSHQLQSSLEQLQQTQAQLVQTEKISQLGQLVAGVAHEVNNPVGFIAGNLSHVQQYIEDLTQHLQLYGQHYPEPPAAIQDHAETIDLAFLLEDLPQMIDSMRMGIDRIRDIMQSLRNYSRADGQEKRAADIHAGINTTLMILSHRLKAQPHRPEIRIVKEYGEIPPVECYIGQLNQVFMNLIANAIDALEELSSNSKADELDQDVYTLTIRTLLCGHHVAIHIIDNGAGMTEATRQKLFDPFFTTKPEGKGTGLGLSISYKIVTEKHGGTLECRSAPGQGAEFIIQIPVTAD